MMGLISRKTSTSGESAAERKLFKTGAKSRSKGRSKGFSGRRDPVLGLEKPDSLRGHLRRAYTRFLALRGTPREIAMGLAAGVFVGMSPFMGFHTAIAVLLAALFRWSKISAAVGVQVTNVFTAPFIYWFTYQVGKHLHASTVPFALPNGFDPASILDFIWKAPELIWILTLGGLIAGVPLTILTYWIAFKAVSKYQLEIKQKIKAKKDKLLQKARKRRQDKRAKRD